MASASSSDRRGVIRATQTIKLILQVAPYMSCIKPDRFFYCLLLTGILALGATGCANTVSISGSVPSPLVDPLPLEVGVHYDESLREYTHYIDEADDGGGWKVKLGETQVQLFDKLFSALFREVVQVEDLESSAQLPDIDLVIQPTIESYSFQTPWGTSTDFYEVDIQYTVSFYTTSGELITHWPIACHGRSRSQLLSADKPLEEATLAAMRDAAAMLVVELREKLDVKGLLDPKPSIHAKIPEPPDS